MSEIQKNAMEHKNCPDGFTRSAVRLLVVDDDPDVLEVMTGQMEAAGYSVLSAVSGTAALALLHNDASVELLIADLLMPGMDGVHLIQEAQRQRPRLPAILVTGLAENGVENALESVISGPIAVMAKPVNFARLAQRAAELLASR